MVHSSESAPIVPMPASFRLAALCGLLAAAACGGAPPPPPPGPAAAVHPADVAFMHGMLAHHAQALEMTALIDGRSDDASIARLGGRIDASQLSEMTRMRQWLEARGMPAAAESHAAHRAEAGLMPGMITPDELRRLAAASGARFDHLFLEYMIRHHQGALTMVETLFATEGAGQEPELFRLASDVDADQRAEIARMRRLLTTLQPGSP